MLLLHIGDYVRIVSLKIFSGHPTILWSWSPHQRPVVLCSWRLADHSHCFLYGSLSLSDNRVHLLYQRYPDVLGHSLQIRTRFKSLRFYRKDEQKDRFRHQPKRNISRTASLSIKTWRWSALKKAYLFYPGPVQIQIAENDDHNADGTSVHNNLWILRPCPDAWSVQAQHLHQWTRSGCLWNNFLSSLLFHDY